jgi:hypothetical protein
VGLHGLYRESYGGLQAWRFRSESDHAWKQQEKLVISFSGPSKRFAAGSQVTALYNHIVQYDQTVKYNSWAACCPVSASGDSSFSNHPWVLAPLARFYFFSVLTRSANQRNWVANKPINNQLLYRQLKLLEYSKQKKKILDTLILNDPILDPDKPWFSRPSNVGPFEES